MQCIYLCIAHLWYALLWILAPPFCLSCRVFLKKRSILCCECLATIKSIATTTLYINKAYQVKIFAVSAYEQPLASMILAKSYGNRAVSCALGELAWECTDIRAAAFDIIIPVPLHWMRYAWRGYNQAHEIAGVISSRAGKPIMHAIKRSKIRPFQSQVSYEERRLNVHEVFEIQSKLRQDIAGKHVLLVDDLMTTGHTLSAICRELIKASPTQISALVICRTV